MGQVSAIQVDWRRITFNLVFALIFCLGAAAQDLPLIATPICLWNNGWQTCSPA